MMMSSLIPITGKIEVHATFRCSLSCLACSRGSWLQRPHTPDMTIDDLDWVFAACDEADWLNRPTIHGEPPRFIMMGGEPTIHRDFLRFVERLTEYSGQYVQVYSNAYTKETRQQLIRATEQHNASVTKESAKTGSVSKAEEFKAALWWFDTFVSPTDAGDLPTPACYCHSSKICGIGVDSVGFSICPIGGTMRAFLGLPRTRKLVDLFDPEIATQMTEDECRHCGYEYAKRKLPDEIVGRFRQYAANQPMTEHGCKMSPTWQDAMKGRKPKRDLPIVKG